MAQGEVPSRLAEGRPSVEDFGPAEAHARYFTDRTDGLRLGRMARLMKAGR